MAKRSGHKKRSDAKEPRPSYGALKAELRRLQTSLKKIRTDGGDTNGDLDGIQLSQVDAAIKEITGARTLLECIQDQAPSQLQEQVRPRYRRSRHLVLLFWEDGRGVLYNYATAMRAPASMPVVAGYWTFARSGGAWRRSPVIWAPVSTVARFVACSTRW